MTRDREDVGRMVREALADSGDEEVRREALAEQAREDEADRLLLRTRERRGLLTEAEEERLRELSS